MKKKKREKNERERKKMVGADKVKEIVGRTGRMIKNRKKERVNKKIEGKNSWRGRKGK